MRTDAYYSTDVDWMLHGKACIGALYPTSGLTWPSHPPYMIVNRLFSLGVEHSLSKRKVDGSNPSIGFSFSWFFWRFLFRLVCFFVSFVAR